jgi:hypothetical protein
MNLKIPYGREREEVNELPHTVVQKVSYTEPMVFCKGNFLSRPLVVLIFMENKES